MGLQGPVPTPTKVLEARGSWRATANAQEPRPKPGKPPCPRGFGDAEKSAWRAVCKVLADMDVLTTADALALEQWRACEEFVAKNGISYPLKAVWIRPFRSAVTASRRARILGALSEFTSSKK
jgi:hypothetical protein